MRMRACSVDDFDEILEIINAAAQAYRGAIPDDRWHDPYMPADTLRREMLEGVRFWGHEEGGRLLGVMGLQHVQNVALIRHAYVRPEHQRRGIAGDLLAHLRALTAMPILIGTWKTATWAIAFYEQHGFVLVGDHEKDRLLRKYWDVPERQIEESVVLADGATLQDLEDAYALASSSRRE